MLVEHDVTDQGESRFGCGRGGDLVRLRGVSIDGEVFEIWTALDEHTSRDDCDSMGLSRLSCE